MEKLLKQRQILLDAFEAARIAVKEATADAEIARRNVIAFDKEHGTLTPDEK